MMSDDVLITKQLDRGSAGVVRVIDLSQPVIDLSQRVIDLSYLKGGDRGPVQRRCDFNRRILISYQRILIC